MCKAGISRTQVQENPEHADSSCHTCRQPQSTDAQWHGQTDQLASAKLTSHGRSWQILDWDMLTCKAAISMTMGPSVLLAGMPMLFGMRPATAARSTSASSCTLCLLSASAAGPLHHDGPVKCDAHAHLQHGRRPQAT